MLGAGSRWRLLGGRRYPRHHHGSEQREQTEASALTDLHGQFLHCEVGRQTE
jgi:hypothetical protein